MCQPERQNDLTIIDGERLFRRIPIYQIVRDDDTGLARFSSGAFKDKELSINIESALMENGGAVDDCLRGHQGYKLASLTAGVARQYSQIVCRDPIPPDNLSHGLICGAKSSRRIYEGLRDSAQWIIPNQAPPYADIELEKSAL